VRIVEAIKRELGIQVGETDRELNFSLEAVRCLGCCGLAPVMTIDGDVYGKLAIARVPRILQRYKEKEPEKVEAE
jgi:NADH:ubiquinone oxidoreductase subunit E